MTGDESPKKALAFLHELCARIERGDILPEPFWVSDEGSSDFLKRRTVTLRFRLRNTETLGLTRMGEPQPIDDQVWRSSSELTKPGFYWWRCPVDDGPLLARGSTSPVKIWMNESGWLAHCFRPGDPLTYMLRRLPGVFYGPISPPDAE